MGDIGLAYGKDLAALYQSALRDVIGRAHEEGAEFPLTIAVTAADGSAWTAVVTLRDGKVDCRHSPDLVASLVFPLRLVAVDARNDTVASMDVMVPQPFSPGEEIN